MRAILTVLFVLLGVNSYADEVYLRNQDKITGTILEENAENVSIKTEAMGIVSVKKDSIERIVKEKDVEIAEGGKKSEKITWQGEISAGYNATRGNTETEEMSLRALVSRNNKHVDEWTFKGDLFYSSADKKMNAQKWYGMGRYAFSFGKTRKWYNLYRLEADHDRFANIHVRTIPAVGIGYWFFDNPDTKLLAEGAVGLRYVDFRDESEDDIAVVLIPRAYGEKKLFKILTISEDIYFYPTIDDFNNYRIHSETACTVDINEKLALRISFIDDYNSNPTEDAEKNDISFISSLVYSF